jgi:pSer/pThr/pTyr-binding forkhead associated (FHA) protein
MWILKTAATPETAALTFRLTPGLIRTVGRSPVADFVVDGPMMSRLHCRVMVSPSGLLEVEDLDSTNGTYVNDRRVSRSVLVSGDLLRLGRVEINVSESRPAG